MQKNLLIIALLALCCGHVTSTALMPAQAAATVHARATYDKHEEINPAIVAMIHDVIEQITIHRSIAEYAAEQNWEKVMELAAQSGIDLNSKDRNGDTALILAAYYGRLDVVTYLTNIKDAMNNPRADLNAVDNRGRTVLMWATHHKCGRLDVVMHLMQIKDTSGKRIIDLKAKNVDGQTVFEWAVYSTPEIREYLQSLNL